MVSFKFHHVFGLSAETVQSQPVLGWKQDENIEDAQVYFFDGYVINIPFMKIMIGEIFDFFEQLDPPVKALPLFGGAFFTAVWIVLLVYGLLRSNQPLTGADMPVPKRLIF